jgi:hypothetical protein
MKFLPRLLPSLLMLPLLAASIAVAQTQPKSTAVPMATLLRCTHDDPLIQALRLMAKTPKAKNSFHQIVDAPVKVVFKDMKSLGKGLGNYDALSWISVKGDQVIYVNEKHRQAPPQALAAMLSHEAMHNDPYNSLNEEVAGWREEVSVWQAFKKADPSLDAIVPGSNALVDRENRLDLEDKNGNLEAFVRNNPGYRNLPDKSPGFGVDRTAINLDSEQAQ